EVDVEILELGGPRPTDGELEPAAGGPAGIGGVLAGKARHRGLEIAESGAAGHVRHEAVDGVADAAAHGGEPVVAERAGAAGADAARGAAAIVGPVDVAFEAEHQLVNLVIVAEGAAHHPPITICALCAEHVAKRRASEIAAAVDADIEARPVVG